MQDGLQRIYFLDKSYHLFCFRQMFYVIHVFWGRVVSSGLELVEEGAGFEKAGEEAKRSYAILANGMERVEIGLDS